MRLISLMFLAALASAAPGKEKRRCRPLSSSSSLSTITVGYVSDSYSSSYFTNTASYSASIGSYAGSTESYPTNTASSLYQVPSSISTSADPSSSTATASSSFTTSAGYSSDTSSSTESTSTITSSYSSTSTDSTSSTTFSFTSTSSASESVTTSSEVSSSTESSTSSAPAPTPTPTFYLQASGVAKGTGNQKNYLPRSNDQYAELYSSGNSANSEILTFAVSSPSPPATAFYLDDQSRLVNAADGYILNTYESSTSNQVYWDADPTGGGWAPPTCQVNVDSTLSCSIGRMNQFSICYGKSGTSLGSNGLLYMTASPPDQGSNCRGVTVNVVYA
ncbi:hypothetical protein F4677DRAFT_427874 [Hypoxylon crocopeplum]|nr:hypothetical protein F4677DRAFT_427874 [Hypoxylon crocopeplum]